MSQGGASRCSALQIVLLCGGSVLVLTTASKSPSSKPCKMIVSVQAQKIILCAIIAQFTHVDTQYTLQLDAGGMHIRIF
jgi:hypothetical protein